MYKVHLLRLPVSMWLLTQTFLLPKLISTLHLWCVRISLYPQTFFLLPWAVPTKTSPILLMTYMAELLVLDDALTLSKADSFLCSFPDLVHLIRVLSAFSCPPKTSLCCFGALFTSVSCLCFPNTKVANISSFHNLLIFHKGILPLPPKKGVFIVLTGL